VLQIPTGEICTVQNVEFIGESASFTLKLPNGKLQSQKIGTLVAGAIALMDALDISPRLPRKGIGWKRK
jgi:hypothetical protein